MACRRHAWLRFQRLRSKDLWLPAERMAGDINDTEHASKPIYRFPKFALLGIPIGAISLGMARASLDEVVRASKEKTPQGSRRPLALRPSLHIDVAKADAALSAARPTFIGPLKRDGRQLKMPRAAWKTDAKCAQPTSMR